MSPLFKKLANGIVSETKLIFMGSETKTLTVEQQDKYPVIRKGQIIGWERI